MQLSREYVNIGAVYLLHIYYLPFLKNLNIYLIRPQLGVKYVQIIFLLLEFFESRMQGKHVQTMYIRIVCAARISIVKPLSKRFIVLTLRLASERRSELDIRRDP